MKKYVLLDLILSASAFAGIILEIGSGYENSITNLIMGSGDNQKTTELFRMNIMSGNLNLDYVASLYSKSHLGVVD